MKINEYRPLIFLVAFSLFYLSQKLIPYFKNKDHKRIYHNWYLLILSILTLKVFFPLGLASITSFFETKAYYLFNISSLPFYLDLIITIIIFDCALYFQHRLFHKFTFLWRMHKVHHSDQEMDTTTGIRFHPTEIIFSAFYKIIFIYLLSPRFETYLIYEGLLSSMALFNHSNLRLSKSLDRILRAFIVTPAMHFPHHDTDNRKMNLNFGNFLSIWDRIFGTYTDEEVDKFGIKEYSSKISIRDIFYMPFK